eukprot:CCRYP_007192-RA/>CCRYP_007192-RA protein AED:0.03 eAED:0.03 QI:254/1/1/1/0.33/0/4/1554/658
MASSILGRKVFPAAAAAITANLACSGGVSSMLDGKFDGLRTNFGTTSRTLCEDGRAEKVASVIGKSNPRANDNLFLIKESGIRETVLRKRMTSIGRFSLKSESTDNPSIPTFFLALAGRKNKSQGHNAGPSSVYSAVSGGQNKFTVSDFESAWMAKDMPTRHPRFHSTVSAHDDRYFEEIHHTTGDEQSSRIKAELDRHASETMHFSVYRDDLRYRLEHMLTSPIEVSDKLWEVKISNGPLGSSGAISRAKVNAIMEKIRNDERHLSDNTKRNEELQRRRFGVGELWSDAARKAEFTPIESVLLFRTHHALADGASIIAALSDLCDEAEEIRADIKRVLRKWKLRGKNGTFMRRLMNRLVRFAKMWIWLTLGSMRAFLYQIYLQMTTRKNPFDAVKADAEKKGLLITGRSVSWCDAAPLEEAKQITQAIGKANGVNITVNDLFVSCITSAIVRQLNEHEEFMAPMEAHEHRPVTRHLNVVVPVHLRGGVVLPGESVGNRIGAFVTRCPGEIEHSDVGEEAIQCPTERILQVNKSLSHSKNSPAPLISHYLAKFCSDYLPDKWTQSLFKRANANACVVVSNNRGYHKKLHIGGMAIEAAHAFLPLPPGIPVGVVVQSYAGGVSLSVTAEKWAVPDPDTFLMWVMEEYERLRNEAAKLQK